MGHLALLLATLAAGVIGLAYTLDERPLDLLRERRWGWVVAAVVAPGCMLGALALLLTSSVVVAAVLAALVELTAIVFIARVHRSTRRLLRGDARHADEVVRELRATRPVRGEQTIEWNTRALAAARALLGGRLHGHVGEVLELVDWSTLIEEHRAAAAGTLGFSHLVQGDVVAAREAVDRAADVDPAEQDPVRELVHLRLLAYEPGSDRALDRMADVDALVRKAPTFRRQALVFRVHALAARGDDEAAIIAARELAEDVGAQVALSMLKVPVGPATALVLEVTARGAYR